MYLVREGNNDEIIKIHAPSEVYELVKDELATADRETFLSVMFASRNILIGVETISIGSVEGTLITPRDVFKSAILANAVSIILCHNHPSGDLIPSKEDIETTKKLIDAGKLLGINVLDHLIVSSEGYKSLREYYKFPE